MKHKTSIQLLPLFAILLLMLQSCGNNPKETVEYLHKSGDQSVQLNELSHARFSILGMAYINHNQHLI